MKHQIFFPFLHVLQKINFSGIWTYQKIEQVHLHTVPTLPAPETFKNNYTYTHFVIACLVLPKMWRHRGEEGSGLPCRSTSDFRYSKMPSAAAAWQTMWSLNKMAQVFLQRVSCAQQNTALFFFRNIDNIFLALAFFQSLTIVLKQTNITRNEHTVVGMLWQINPRCHFLIWTCIQKWVLFVKHISKTISNIRDFTCTKHI